MQKDTVILGIDPGTVITGYGLIKVEGQKYIPIDFGSIRPPPRFDLSKRYLILFQSAQNLIKKFRPTAIAVETQFVKKNVSSAMKLGMARGSILLAAELHEVPIFEYAPKRAKCAVVGNGSASKEQVQKMMQMLLSLSSVPEPEDAADALALAICHAQEKKYV